MDKATAMDMWNFFFKKVKGTPPWYWQSSTAKKTKTKTITKVAKANKELIMKCEDISEEEYAYLETYCKKELAAEIRKLKKCSKDLNT